MPITYICAWQAAGLPPLAEIVSRITHAADEREPGAAVLLRDQRGEPAVLGERLHELVGVAVGLQAAPVRAVEALAQLASPPAGCL